ncbi:MAG TPA: hypothetical protein VFD03_05720 [Clostridia bacterium]|nr:hypothetical protein [Clostridia bacterium]
MKKKQMPLGINHDGKLITFKAEIRKPIALVLNEEELRIMNELIRLRVMGDDPDGDWGEHCYQSNLFLQTVPKMGRNATKFRYST